MFVEVERSVKLPGQLLEMIDDINRLTDVTMDDWHFTYFRDRKTKYPLTDENLRKHVLLTPSEYIKAVSKVEKEDKEDIDSIKSAAGITSKKSKKEKKDRDLEALQSAAGIK